MFHRTSTRSPRSLAAAVAVTVATAALVVLGAPGRAEAQITGTGGSTLTGTGGSGGTAFVASDFFTSIQQQSVPPVSLTTFELSRFFNKANCDCATHVNVFIALLDTGVAKRATAGITTGTVSVVLGNLCNSVFGLQNGQSVGSCRQIASESVLTFLSQASYTVDTDAQTLSTYFNATGVSADGGYTSTGTAAACTAPTAQSFTTTVNFNFDFGSGTIDLSVPFMLLVDLVPPPAPTGVRIQGGDEALVINWDSVDQALYPDLLGYQILCSRADKYQVFNEVGTNDGGTSTGAFASASRSAPARKPEWGSKASIPSSSARRSCRRKRPPNGWRSSRTTSPTRPRWSPSTPAETRASRWSDTAPRSRR